MQPQMTTLLAIAQGTSIVTEGVWDNRFKYVDELHRMGAKIQVDGKVAVVEGVEQLSGVHVKALDLRAGVALVQAALSAKAPPRSRTSTGSSAVMKTWLANCRAWVRISAR